MRFDRRAVLKVVVAACTMTCTPATVAGVGLADVRRLLESRESLYNSIYVYQEGNYISMTFGQNPKLYTESVYNTLDPEDLPVRYTQMMTASVMYPPKIQSILEIGFGGGRTASYLHRFMPKVKIVSVELDPAVVEFARKYFDFKDDDNFKVVTN